METKNIVIEKLIQGDLFDDKLVLRDDFDGDLFYAQIDSMRTCSAKMLGLSICYYYGFGVIDDTYQSMFYVLKAMTYYEYNVFDFLVRFFIDKNIELDPSIIDWKGSSTSLRKHIKEIFNKLKRNFDNTKHGYLDESLLIERIKVNKDKKRDFIITTNLMNDIDFFKENVIQSMQYSNLAVEYLVKLLRYALDNNVEVDYISAIVNCIISKNNYDDTELVETVDYDLLHTLVERKLYTIAIPLLETQIEPGCDENIDPDISALLAICYYKTKNKAKTIYSISYALKNDYTKEDPLFIEYASLFNRY